MKEFPKVFVVILNFNGRNVLKDCLKSVFASDYPDFSVVLVDNDSRDGSFEMAKEQFSRAYFIKNEKNIGFAAGNNVGIRFSLERGADWVWILNNDTQVEPDALSKMVGAGKKGNFGILSPVIFEGGGNKIWFSGGRINWFKMRVEHFKEPFKEEVRESDFVTGCAMLVKKEVFKRVGLLDEDFFLYYEDADFGERAARAGFLKGVVSGSWIYHLENSQKNFSGKLYWLVLSGLMFFQKNSRGIRKMFIAPLTFLRRAKNLKERIFFPGEKARIIAKAFKDFNLYLKKNKDV